MSKGHRLRIGKVKSHKSKMKGKHTATDHLLIRITSGTEWPSTLILATRSKTDNGLLYHLRSF